MQSIQGFTAKEVIRALYVGYRALLDRPRAPSKDVRCACLYDGYLVTYDGLRIAYYRYESARYGYSLREDKSNQDRKRSQTENRIIHQFWQKLTANDSAIPLYLVYKHWNQYKGRITATKYTETKTREFITWYNHLLTARSQPRDDIPTWSEKIAYLNYCYNHGIDP